MIQRTGPQAGKSKSLLCARKKEGRRDEEDISMKNRLRAGLQASFGDFNNLQAGWGMTQLSFAGSALSC